MRKLVLPKAKSLFHKSTNVRVSFYPYLIVKVLYVLMYTLVIRLSVGPNADVRRNYSKF